MLKRNLSDKTILLFVITLIFSVWIYTRYFTNIIFGDEYDNFTYSWLFKNGVLPYRDVFSHQYPLLVFLGIPLEFIGHSQTIYRVFVLFGNFLFFVFSYLYLKGTWRLSILLFMLFSSFAMSFYGGFQFDDATYWAILLISSFLIVVTKEGKLFSWGESILLGFFAWLIMFSSPLHLIAFPTLMGFHFLMQRKQKPKIKFGDGLNNLLPSFLPIGLLSLSFFTYLLITNSLSSFYYDTIVFNSQTFYQRLYEPYVNIRILDFYLHTSRNVLNHFYELIKFQGSHLLIFLKSSKFLVWPFGQSFDYSNYLKIVSGDFYNNFFTFEIFIALFYLIGIFVLVLQRKFALAFFCFLYIFAIRLRIQTRYHMSPYYLFSYLALAYGLTFAIRGLFEKKRAFGQIVVLIFALTVTSLFIAKNWYDFNQTAFNRFPVADAETVNIIKEKSIPSEQIFVLGSTTANYYYDSERFPHGYFINYFKWYDWSEKLRKRLMEDLRSYHGNFLIVTGETWEAYERKNVEDWIIPYLDVINSNFKKENLSTPDAIFRRN